ncbi:hypothetical protein C240_2691 [Enterococcus sp. 5H]|nr:hypothetical protein [Enterococcus sp. 5H]
MAANLNFFVLSKKMICYFFVIFFEKIYKRWNGMERGFNLKWANAREF